MSRYILLLSIFLFLNCNKRDECVDITDKKQIDGLYYFYFKAKMTGSYTNNQGNSSNGFSQNRWASGEVSEEIYNSFNIGDEYCY